MVLLALCDNANDQGECYPSVPMLAIKCSLSERSVQQHIHDLETAGSVSREMRTGRSTLYRIHSSKFTPADSAPRKICTPQNLHPTPADSAPPPPQPLHPTPATAAPITIIEPSIESSGTITSSSLVVVPAKPRTVKAKPGAWSEDFEAIWPLYPRKPGMSKADALKAFSARVNEGVSIDDLQAGVQAYAAYVLAARTEPKYIKSPETFFGPGRHWESDWRPPAQVSGRTANAQQTIENLQAYLNEHEN